MSAARRIVTGEPGFWGGQIAHVGFALLAIGVAASTSLAVREQVSLDVGDSQVVDNYCVGYLGSFNRTETNRFVEGAEIVLMEADCSTEIARMFPRVNRYPNFAQGAVATPDVHTGLVEDVYLSLAGSTGDTLVLDVFVFPLMWVLWLGGLLVFGGGMFSFLVKKRRRTVDVPDEPPLVGAGT